MRTATILWVVGLAATTLSGCRGERAVDIATAECPSREKAGTITVADGRILLDKPGAYDRVCSGSGPPTGKGATGCVDHHFYVLPLVPNSWVVGDPVPAWVTCQGNHKDVAACVAEATAYRGPIGGDVAVRTGDSSRPGRTVSGWESAVDDAQKRHGLTSSTRAPVLWLGRL